jgi:uncharacterized protein YjlB
MNDMNDEAKVEVKFLQDRVVQDGHEGTAKETRFKAGDVVKLPAASAEHWVRRGVAIDMESVKAAAAAEKATKADPKPTKAEKAVAAAQEAVAAAQKDVEAAGDDKDKAAAAKAALAEAEDALKAAQAAAAK